MIKQLSSLMKEVGIKYEIIVVDDNSPGGTGKIVKRIMKENKHIRLISRKEKKGLFSAVVDGIKHAKGEIICVMDADFSHPVKYVPLMLKEIKRGCDFVIGSRYIPGGKIIKWKKHRILMSKTASLLAFPLTKVRDSVSGFFMVRKKCIDLRRLKPIGFKICLELIIKGKYRKLKEIPIEFKDREEGESKLGVKEIFLFIYHLLRLLLWRI